MCKYGDIQFLLLKQTFLCYIFSFSQSYKILQSYYNESKIRMVYLANNSCMNLPRNSSTGQLSRNSSKGRKKQMSKYRQPQLPTTRRVKVPANGIYIKFSYQELVHKTQLHKGKKAWNKCLLIRVWQRLGLAEIWEHSTKLMKIFLFLWINIH